MTTVLASLAALLIGAAPAIAQGGGNGGLVAYIRSLPLEPIDRNELTDLETMRQEEKMARDVYLVLDMMWHLPIFANIAQGEQEHMDLVELVLDRYGIADPLPSDDIGVFRDQVFRDWFVGLAVFGLQSPLHAGIVGALIEDLDIVDLETAIGRADNRDVLTVWQNLERGSRNHLRAFDGYLLQSGYRYYPIFLTVPDYQAIVSSPREPFPVDENGDRLR